MTDAELNELEAKAIAVGNTDGCERSLQADTEYIKASRPWKILKLIKELRQTRRELDWLADQIGDSFACYPPSGAYCDKHSCDRCKYTSKDTWLKAAKRATCHHAQ